MFDQLMVRGLAKWTLVLLAAFGDPAITFANANSAAVPDTIEIAPDDVGISGCCPSLAG